MKEVEGFTIVNNNKISVKLVTEQRGEHVEFIKTH